MASNKTFAAVDFQGAANITISGNAGDSGQVLTSSGSGAMSWSDVTDGSIGDGTIDTHHLAGFSVTDGKLAPNAVVVSTITNSAVTMPKLAGWKKFNVYWKNSGGTSSAGVSFDSGSPLKLIITHGLGSAYLLFSMLDIDDHFGDGANRYVDFASNLTKIQYVDDNTSWFNMETLPDDGDQFKVAILGGE